jgi:hypothetical protein
MLTRIGSPRSKHLAALLLASPAISLLAAVTVVWANANLLAGIPLGLHTLVPLDVLVPLPVLAVAAAGGLLLALVLFGYSRRHGSTTRLPGAETVVLLAGAQAVLFAAQLLLVDQLHGVPDAGVALVLAFAVQAVFVALTAAAAIALRVAIPTVPVPPAFSPGRAIFLFNPAPAPIFARSDVYRIGSRRGPPVPLLSD